MVQALRQVRKLFQHEPSSSEFYLIVGLGNPGREYAGNRHNVGFQCVDRLADAHGMALRKNRFGASLEEGHIGARHVVLAKPLTFMNDSGKAVGPISKWYKIPPERILVIYDNLDLPLGKVRLRPNGSSGGHKGINSIIAALGTRDFGRLRVGIGRPTYGDPVDYVLGNFDREQSPVIQAAYDQVLRIVPCFLEEGMLKAMNTYNGQDS
jgi:peptidyl-tRNA hydrolase, PTH1 family